MPQPTHQGLVPEPVPLPFSAMFFGPLRTPPPNDDGSSLFGYQRHVVIVPVGKTHLRVQLGGSCSSITPPGIVGVQVYIDQSPCLVNCRVYDPQEGGIVDKQIAAAARAYDDAQPGRNTLVPLSLIVPITEGNHELWFVPLPSSFADDNDTFSLFIDAI